MNTKFETWTLIEYKKQDIRIANKRKKKKINYNWKTW
jgi:hypothetical protein